MLLACNKRDQASRLFLPKELIVSLLGSGIKNGVLGEIYLIRDCTVLSPITLAPLGNRTRLVPGC